jgi:hypothetical protein
MTLTKQQVRKVLDVYIRAWEDQDPDLIGTIFTEGASYLLLKNVLVGVVCGCCAGW